MQSGITPSAEYQTEVSQFFSGLSKREARVGSSNRARVQNAKECMPYGVYKALMELALRSDAEVYRFAHAYGVLQWNLMSRAGTVADIHSSRITSTEDSLLIYNATTKSGTEFTAEPIHLYANPEEPAICPVFALSLYWLESGPCNVAIGPDGKLFPGTAQAHRFGDILRSLLETKEMEPILEAHGLVASDLGPPAFRKGATTYVAPGGPGSPPFYAVCQRALWKLDGVQASSIRYERADDQFLEGVLQGTTERAHPL